MNSAGIRLKLGSEYFPDLSDRLRLLLDFVFAETEPGTGLAASAINRIVVSINGEVRAWSGDDSAIYLGKETEICQQLRRLVQAANLDADERRDYEQQLFERAGLLLTPRQGCHAR
jgi:hypothetical protein